MNNEYGITLSLLALALLVGLIVATPPADAASPVEACAKLVHANSGTPSHRVNIRASTDTLASTADCTPRPLTLVEGECVTFNIKYSRDGVTAPPAPAAIEAYWFHGPDATDHGATGNDNWPYRPLDGVGYVASAIYSTGALPASKTFCATANGQSTGAHLPGEYRLVLRSCSPNAAGCSGTADSYDVNSDTNPTCACSGNVGVGYTANGHAGNLTAYDVTRDPLKTAETTVIMLGASFNWSLSAKFLNDTVRTGAASNITLHVEAPDHSWPVNGATPAEVSTPDGRGTGDYWYNFTPTAPGPWVLRARTISSLNEMHFTTHIVMVQPVEIAPPTRGHLDAFETRLNATFALVAREASTHAQTAYLAPFHNATKSAADAAAAATHAQTAYLAPLTNASTDAALAAASATHAQTAYLAPLHNATQSALGDVAAAQDSHAAASAASLAAIHGGVEGIAFYGHAGNHTDASGSVVAFSTQDASSHAALASSVATTGERVARIEARAPIAFAALALVILIAQIAGARRP